MTDGSLLVYVDLCRDCSSAKCDLFHTLRYQNFG
jgi:hypothetical protein